MPASAVSSPTASTRTRIAESVATVPATTRSPALRATGRDSPVIIDSSSSAAPSTIRAVGGHPGAGAHQHDVADPQVGDRDRLDRRRRSTRSASSGSSAASAARAPCAWPIAFISCQWPSSMIVTSAASSHQKSRSNAPNAGGERGRVRDRDRHRDQQHHAGRAVAHLADAADQERPAAVEEDDRAEHRADPRDAGEVQRVAEPVHDHLAGRDDRHGQRQAQPELAPEHLRVVARVLVVLVVHACNIPLGGTVRAPSRT